MSMQFNLYIILIALISVKVQIGNDVQIAVYFRYTMKKNAAVVTHRLNNIDVVCQLKLSRLLNSCRSFNKQV